MLDAELAEIVNNLRTIGADIADVEVKKAQGGLPFRHRRTSGPGRLRTRHIDRNPPLDQIPTVPANNLSERPVRSGRPQTGTTRRPRR